uniref:Uncharacterized protein n=1 Tax=Arundo donax TaxID=35708 RepID=A0A0A9CFQ1_ARUDO
MSPSPSPRLRCTSSSTALPPACTQKCSNARRKSGMYGRAPPPERSTRRSTRDLRNLSCSESGSTSGPSVVMFVFSASPATAMSSLASDTPTFPPSPSSRWYTQP